MIAISNIPIENVLVLTLTTFKAHTSYLIVDHPVRLEFHPKCTKENQDKYKL